jgi:hypothetical protein
MTVCHAKSYGSLHICDLCCKVWDTASCPKKPACRPKLDKLEEDIEDAYVNFVKADGALSLKYELRNGDPDQLTLLNHGGHFFIEFKRPKKEPRKLQWIRINELRGMGHAVYWTDSFEEAVTIYTYEKYKAEDYDQDFEDLKRQVEHILSRRG